ncbi:acyl-CoA thioesterase [Nocardioides sp. BP30]|uniref:acyl-CoA thioesterase n=1 Tax=Nocardioides sp. BP30 TaxID=3036374 RepID=UPI0024696153|nr:acyl-CoA thioesterase [Nocardioides sp. BP30]WGL51527.1 acyl-CoA thioesterase [Nocardioides sp. BP30]
MNGADPRRPTTYGEVSLAVLMRTAEANLAGNIHGGEIVKLADSTAGAVSSRHAGGQTVTAALDEMVFIAPVHVGDIVHTYGRVNWVGRTSLEVGVRIEAQPHSDPSVGGVHVASAYFVMVALNPDGTPREVPPLLLESAEDHRRWREAQIRRAHRLAKREEILRGRNA